MAKCPPTKWRRVMSQAEQDEHRGSSCLAQAGQVIHPLSLHCGWLWRVWEHGVQGTHRASCRLGCLWIQVLPRACAVARGLGPTILNASMHACDTGWMPRHTGGCQQRPAPCRGNDMTDAVRRFKTRCAFALRHLRKDAPTAGEACRLEMAKAMKLAEGPTGYSASTKVHLPAPVPTAPGRFYIGSDDGGGQPGDEEKLLDLERRVQQCEQDMVAMTHAICQCPIFDFACLGAKVGQDGIRARTEGEAAVTMATEHVMQHGIPARTEAITF